MRITIGNEIFIVSETENGYNIKSLTSDTLANSFVVYRLLSPVRSNSSAIFPSVMYSTVYFVSTVAFPVLYKLQPIKSLNI